MPGEINLGDNYQIDEDGSGNLVIKDSTGTTVLQHTDGGGWTVGANIDHGGNDITNVNSVTATSASVDEILAADSILEIRSLGGGADSVSVRDTANGQDLMTWNEGGPVEVQNADLNVANGRLTLQNGDPILELDADDTSFGRLEFNEATRGALFQLQFRPQANRLQIFDNVNAQTLMRFSLGGPVEVLNADLELTTGRLDYTGAQFSDTNDSMTANPETDTESGYIEVKINGATKQIPFYDP